MRRKKLPTRRRTALRWLCAALLALLLANQIFGIGYLLPAQTLREMEQYWGTGRTKTVYSRVDDRSVISLSANEQAMIFAQIYPTLVGWANTAWVLDCSDPAAIYGSFRDVSREARPQIPYAWGRVDDPEITEVRLSFRYALREEEDRERTGPETDFAVATHREDWTEQDGMAYFVLRLDPMGPGYHRVVYRDVTLTGLNDRGETVARIAVSAGGTYGKRSIP